LPVDYLPILIMFIVATGMATAALILPHFLGPYIYNKAKQETIESGKLNYGDARRRVPVQYYVVAMLFIFLTLKYCFSIRGLCCFGILSGLASFRSVYLCFAG
jgi:NADH-quinone oxidoreductase subunit A